MPTSPAGFKNIPHPLATIMPLADFPFIAELNRRRKPWPSTFAWNFIRSARKPHEHWRFQREKNFDAMAMSNAQCSSAANFTRFARASISRWRAAAPRLRSSFPLHRGLTPAANPNGAAGRLNTRRTTLFRVGGVSVQTPQWLAFFHHRRALLVRAANLENDRCLSLFPAAPQNRLAPRRNPR